MDNGSRRVELTADAYDERWDRLAAAGHEVHGEARLVEAMTAQLRVGGPGPVRVLDAGCGTGRVAIELARSGFDVTGVDVDPVLLARAREKAPMLPWVQADLASLVPCGVPGPFDVVVMAGNVMIFLAPGTEAAVVRNLAACLAPGPPRRGGIVVAGFQLRRGGLTVAQFDECARDAGLVPVARFSTWERDPFTAGGDYVVTVDRASDADEAQ